MDNKDVFVWDGKSKVPGDVVHVRIADGVTEIGGVFMDCKSLQSVDIPDGVTMIDGYAFCGCESLQSVNIPDSVTKICKHAFRGCPDDMIINYKGQAMGVAQFSGVFEDSFKDVCKMPEDEEVREVIDIIEMSDSENQMLLGQ